MKRKTCSKIKRGYPIKRSKTLIQVSLQNFVTVEPSLAARIRDILLRDQPGCELHTLRSILLHHAALVKALILCGNFLGVNGKRCERLPLLLNNEIYEEVALFEKSLAPLRRSLGQLSFQSSVGIVDSIHRSLTTLAQDLEKWIGEAPMDVNSRVELLSFMRGEKKAQGNFVTNLQSFHDSDVVMTLIHKSKVSVSENTECGCDAETKCETLRALEKKARRIVAVANYFHDEPIHANVKILNNLAWVNEKNKSLGNESVSVSLSFLKSICAKLHDALSITHEYSESHCGAYSFAVATAGNVSTLGERIVFNQNLNNSDFHEFMELMHQTKGSLQRLMTYLEDTDEKPHVYSASRGDYIRFPHLNAGRNSSLSLMRNGVINFSRAFYFSIFTANHKLLEMFYTKLERLAKNVGSGSTFGSLVGVEAERSLKGDARRVCHIKFDGFHKVNGSLQDAFTPIHSWLRTQTYPGTIKMRCISDRDAIDLNMKYNVGFRKRVVTPELVQECVRQIVCACSTLELIGERFLTILQSVDLIDLIVDRFNRVAIVVGNDAHKSLNERVWKFNGAAPADDTSRSPTIHRLLRGAAAVLADGLYVGERGFELNNARSFNAALVPARTRFNEVTPVDAIDFMRSAFNYETSAASLLAHPYFTVNRQRGALETEQRQFHLDRTSFARFVNTSAVDRGKDVIAYRVPQLKDAAIAHYNVANGEEAERFAVLVRTFSSCALAQSNRVHQYENCVRLDIVTPGRWPACVNLDSGAVRSTCNARVHGRHRHDDYFKHSEQEISAEFNVHSVYDCYIKRFRSHETVLCHTCLGACRTSKLFRELNDKVFDKEQKLKKEAAEAEEIILDSPQIPRRIFDIYVVQLSRMCRNAEVQEFLSGPTFERAKSIERSFIQRIASLSHNRSQAEMILVSIGDEVKTSRIEPLWRILQLIQGEKEKHEAERRVEAEAAIEEADEDYVPQSPVSSSDEAIATAGDGSSGETPFFNVNPEFANFISSRVLMDNYFEPPERPPNVIGSNVSYTHHKKKEKLVPECVKNSDDHIDPVFSFVSLFRSFRVMRTIEAAIFEHRPIVIYNSMQKGVGDGVTMSIWDDFWRALFEEHKLFKKCGENEYYTLVPLSEDASSIIQITSGEGNSDMSLSSENIKCKACTRYARSLDSTHKELNCQVASRRFMRTLGSMMLYCLVNEIPIPYRLHPALLFLLCEPNSVQTAIETGSVHITNEFVDAQRFFNPMATNNFLNVKHKDLEALYMDFSWQQNSQPLDLNECNAFGYLRSQVNPFNVLSSAQLRLWNWCASSFDFLPVSTLVRAVCGHGSATSVLAFGAILHGSAGECTTGKDLFKAASFRISVPERVENFAQGTLRAVDVEPTNILMQTAHYAVVGVYQENVNLTPRSAEHKAKIHLLDRYSSIIFRYFVRVESNELDVVQLSEHCNYVTVLPFDDNNDNDSISILNFVKSGVENVCRKATASMDYALKHRSSVLPSFLKEPINFMRQLENFSAIIEDDSEHTALVRCMLYMEAFIKNTNALWVLFSNAEGENYNAGRDTENDIGDGRFVHPSYTSLHEAVDILLEFSTTLMTMLQTNTYMYWRRWLLEDSSETQRSAFLYTSTASRTIPSTTKRIAQTKSTVEPDVSLGQALMSIGDGIERVYGKEVSIENVDVRGMARWSASFGTIASNIAMPAVSVDYAKSVLVSNKMPTVRDFQRAEPSSRAAVTVHALMGPSFVDKYQFADDVKLRESNPLFFEWMDKENMSTRFGKTLRRLSELRYVRHFSDAILNRTPEYSVCDKHARLFVYSSYDAFKRAMEISIDECNSDFNLT